MQILFHLIFDHHYDLNIEMKFENYLKENKQTHL
jgi:hypothetical protein